MRWENVLSSTYNNLGVFLANSFTRFEPLVLLSSKIEYFSSSSLGNVNQHLLLLSPPTISFLHIVLQTLNYTKKELRTALGNQHATIKY